MILYKGENFFNAFLKISKNIFVLVVFWGSRNQLRGGHSGGWMIVVIEIPGFFPKCNNSTYVMLNILG